MTFDDLFTLRPLADDPLGVLETTAPVVRENPWVKINTERVADFARRNQTTIPPEHGEEAFHCAFLPPRRFVNFLLLLEALNFSFWDAEPRWRVAWRGGLHDGYWALAAALHRAVAQDALPLWDARWMAQLEAGELDALLAGQGGGEHPVPMLAERLNHVREVGAALLRDWEGEAMNMVIGAGHDAPTLALLIERGFSSFRDVALWQGSPVRFLKRAQIFCADLARLYPDLPGGPLCGLHGLGSLTAFADYKVPQVLRKEGVLEYAPELAARLGAMEELPVGAPEEVSIRAATIWACEWIARALSRLRGEGQTVATPADVDYLLWSAGQEKTGLLPYHRTRTPYY